MKYRKPWTLALAGSLVMVACYFLLPNQGLAQNLGYNVIGLLGTAFMLLGVRLHRPARPALWYWFAAGQTCSVTGDIVWEIYEYVLHQSPYPSMADVFYLSSYPLLSVGLVMLVRERNGRSARDLAGIIDAAIITIGLGLAFWIFVLHPVAATDGSALQRIIGTAYPAADAMLLLILARAGTAAAVPTVSTRMLGIAALLLLAADVAYSVLTQYSAYDGGSALDAFWLLSYVLWGIAALHPSMAAPVATDQDPVHRTTVGPARLALMTASSLIVPCLLLLPSVSEHTSNRIAVAVAAVCLLLLAGMRIWGFAREVQGQAGRLEDLALHDELTGLANRRHFQLRLTAAVKTGRPYVALLDVDDFRTVNDQLGQSVGDRLLMAFAQNLEHAVGGAGYAARMGADEFAVLLPAPTDEAATAAVERIMRTLRTPLTAGDHELLVSASAGIAGGEVSDPLELLRRADVAARAARDVGEPFLWYRPELDRQATEEARIGAALRTALPGIQGDGQFHLVYQPIVELPHGRLVAVEALVRWEHPEYGMIGPASFIPVAERNGLIVDLGAWVLQEACRQAAAWRAELGPDAPQRVSVNVSPRQLSRPGLVRTVASALADSGLPAGCLTIEVTETAVFEGGPALAALHELRELGVRIALDDFGTGQSSLTLLRTVPAQVLKVDKSFVDEIGTGGAGGQSEVIADALIRIADGLGMTAVAEGVETEEQARELYRLGYRLAQGYFFGKPAADLPKKLLAIGTA